MRPIIESLPKDRSGYCSKVELTIGWDKQGETRVGIVKGTPRAVASCSGCLHIPRAIQEFAFRLEVGGEGTGGGVDGKEGSKGVS